MDKEIIINCLGDSTTWGENGFNTGGPEISWVHQLPNLLPNITTRNYGQRSSRIAANRSDSFLERYKTMDDEADIIFVMGGVNDFLNDIPMGYFGSTNPTTFYGALHQLLSGLYRKYPHAQLIFATPAKEKFTKHNGRTYPNSFQLNGQYHSQIDYVNAIKQVCDRFSIPVIDLYSISGISPFLAAQQPLMPDGLHYTAEAYQLLAKRIAGQLKPFLPLA